MNPTANFITLAIVHCENQRQALPEPCLALFNSWPENHDGWGDELDEKRWQAVDGVTRWPDHYLFGQLP